MEYTPINDAANHLIALVEKNDIPAITEFLKKHPDPALLVTSRGSDHPHTHALFRAAALNRCDVLNLFVGRTDVHNIFGRRKPDLDATTYSMSNDGSTALCAAAGRGHKAAVKLLLEYGARVNARGRYDVADTQDEKTALMAAARTGRTDIAELLIAKGADLRLKDHSGMTAMRFALANKHKETIALFQKNGAPMEEPNDITICTWPPAEHLISLVYAGDMAGIKNFLQNPELGPDYITARDDMADNSDMPLCAAAETGQTEILRLFIANCPREDIDATTRSGHTALYAAAYHGRIEALRLLLERGANPNFYTYADRDTPFEAAIKQNRPEAIGLMLRHGAKFGKKEIALAEFEGLDDIAAFLRSVAEQSKNTLTPQQQLRHGTDLNKYKL